MRGSLPPPLSLSLYFWLIRTGRKPQRRNNEKTQLKKKKRVKETKTEKQAEYYNKNGDVTVVLKIIRMSKYKISYKFVIYAATITNAVKIMAEISEEMSV